MVIYLINPFSHQEAIVDLCFAFLALFYAYVQSPTIQQSRSVHEIVLQIVPLAFIYEATSSVPTQMQFSSLALEVYERCALIETEAGQLQPFSQPSPAVLLAQPIPSRINFKLSADPPQSLLHENQCLHIAYACSADGRWISVAWSDSRGDLQTCTSFCLTRSQASPHRRQFSEVAKEVWETSAGMIQSNTMAWRFMLAKVGGMDADEIEGKHRCGLQSPSSFAKTKEKDSC